jgi:multidrug resistance efflux pump
MASSFTHTLRSLDSERVAHALPRLAVGVTVLGAWGCWMTLAQVTVYASTPSARLEVTQIANRVAAQEAGRITALHVELGRVVEPNEVLVELESSVENRKLEEQLTHVSILVPKVDALRRQIEAERDATALQSRVSSVAIQRAKVDLDVAEINATYEKELRSISDLLGAAALNSRVSTLGAAKDAESGQLLAKGARVELSKLSATHKYDERRALVHILELERQLADFEGETRSALAEVETARAQIERRRIRAPVAGKLGNITPLQIGDVVRPGDAVATVIPSDDIHVVGEFAPADAVGRVLPGQPARVRLTGFPWTRFGILRANVTQVASEPHDGTIRVELVIEATGSRAVPIQHGLPGSVEVEVDHVSPFGLILRQVTGLATVPEPALPPPPPPQPSDVRASN